MTTLGRFVGVWVMFAGVLVMALPISIFGASFANEWRSSASVTSGGLASVGGGSPPARSTDGVVPSASLQLSSAVHTSPSVCTPPLPRFLPSRGGVTVGSGAGAAMGDSAPVSVGNNFWREQRVRVEHDDCLVSLVPVELLPSVSVAPASVLPSVEAASAVLQSLTTLKADVAALTVAVAAVAARLDRLDAARASLGSSQAMQL